MLEWSIGAVSKTVFSWVRIPLRSLRLGAPTLGAEIVRQAQTT